MPSRFGNRKQHSTCQKHTNIPAYKPKTLMPRGIAKSAEPVSNKRSTDGNMVDLTSTMQQIIILIKKKQSHLIFSCK
jgi:hypothetical protein